MKDTSEYKYRICRSCGLEWNVSIHNEAGKKYTCPRCTNFKNIKHNKDENESRNSGGKLPHP